MTEIDIFRALSDPTRRAVYERLAHGEKNATELRDGMEISQPAISQHLGVLRGAGLITEQKQGRQVQYSVEPAGLMPLFSWIERNSALWPVRMARLKTLLKEMDQ